MSKQPHWVPVALVHLSKPAIAAVHQYAEDYERSANERLLALNAELVEALRPFAKLAELLDLGVESFPHTGPIYQWSRKCGDYELTVEDLRSAAAALAKATP